MKQIYQGSQVTHSALEQSSRCQHQVANMGALLAVEYSSPAVLGRQPATFFTKTAQTEATVRLISGGPEACIWVLGARVP